MSWFKRSASHEQAQEPWAAPAQSTPVNSDYPTPDNKLFFQAFEWNATSQPPPPHETHAWDSHWSRLTRVLPKLAELGVTSVWLPPGCKANSPQGNGYDCYDLWDLGEFDQKWTRSTKWGSIEELRDLVEVASKCGQVGVDLIWDAVLNHKTAGDATDEAWAVEVDGQDRRIEICSPRKIEAWLKYDFPGRDRGGMKYSGLKWRAEHFNGTDWDQRTHKNAIYKLIDDPATYPKPSRGEKHESDGGRSGLNRLARFAGNVSSALAERRMPTKRPGKGWHEDVDTTYGNYDWLIFSNVYYLHPDVREDVSRWGQWMVEHIGIHGFRLDAAQHISWTFMREWIAHVSAASLKRHGKHPFIVGEVLAAEVTRQLKWLDAVTPLGSPTLACAFDAPLVYSFSRVSEDVRRGSRSADLRTLLSGPGNSDKQALMAVRPNQAVTFVTNHDTQTGQSSFIPMDASLKALFYAFILLRSEGHPCVFLGDLYGTRGDKKHAPEGPACQLPAEPSPSENPHRSSASPSKQLRSVLPSLMLARTLFAYGAQTDYFDAMSCIGWTRAGTHDRPGCAVVMSIGLAHKWTIKKMRIGRPGEKWVDVLHEVEGRSEIMIDEQGFGVFACRGRTVTVYVREDGELTGRFPVNFDHDFYRQ